MSEVLRPLDRLRQAINRHDLDALARCFNERAVLVAPDGIAENKEEIASYYGEWMDAFPNMVITPQSVTMFQDTVAVEFTISGTHKGPLLVPGGDVLEGTGRSVLVRSCSFSTVEGGTILSHRLFYDQLEMAAQIGGHLRFGDGP
ncbi:ester cyclase [Microbispora bryophytorum]|uniref:Nuclear transport factor 2 family protein n=1 Tax=Microbispora bryophytorum subsp. camponoti TaxID=1677852 RepID=A0ABR8KZJ9_9ACTN|nr:nuclear transport factor 2 family protein [Microbispora camponoti]MBD3143112.1 nuclear transport factor 2 family protein [Microbispora camponoti]